MGECELFGFFGLFVQLVLGAVSVGSLAAKKFLPGEKRSWKVFCMDIWKQLLTQLFAHFLNLFLAVYLQELTQEGNGCVWYFMNMALDTIFGMFINWCLFKIVDYFAVKYEIEVLKSGVYTDETVQVEDDEDQDKHINYRIWILQMVVWCIIVFIAKIFVFLFEVVNHHQIVQIGEDCLQIFEGYPKLELICVMIIIPVTCNLVMFWVQDNFLKGDEHLDERREMHGRMSHIAALEMEKQKSEQKAKVEDDDSLQYEEIEEDGFVVLKMKPQRLNRVIEEGIYNIKKEDYDENGCIEDEYVVINIKDISRTSSAHSRKNLREERKADGSGKLIEMLSGSDLY